MAKEFQDDVARANELANGLSEEQIPQILVEAMAGKPLRVAGIPKDLISDQSPNERGSETKGLILSKDNIIKIKEYVKYGNSLPLDLPSIKAYLGYDNFYNIEEYEGLKIENFERLHRNIEAHCSLWSNLEKDIKSTGTSLNIFGQNFVITGTDIVEAIDEMPITKKIKTLREAGSEIVFESEDSDIKLALLELIDGLKVQVKKRQTDTNALLTRIENYRNEMECKIIPMSTRMNATLRNLKLDNKMTALLADIQDLEKEVKTLDSQYDKMVGLAFTGAAGLIAGPVGIITWAVTGGVYGDKAEKVRKQRNKCKHALKQKQAEFNSTDRMKTFVSGVNEKMLEMKIILDDAVTGIKNLEVLWASVAQYINDSYSQLEAVNDLTRLLIFKNRMASAVASWKEVRDITYELVALFEEAEAAVKLAEAKAEKEGKEEPDKNEETAADADKTGGEAGDTGDEAGENGNGAAAADGKGKE